MQKFFVYFFFSVYFLIARINLSQLLSSLKQLERDKGLPTKGSTTWALDRQATWRLDLQEVCVDNKLGSAVLSGHS